MDYYTYLRSMDFFNQMQCDFETSRLSNEPWPLTFQTKSSQYLLSKAIEKVKDYILDENNDEAFYNKLIMQAPNDEEKKIISDIRDDEKSHAKIFRKIFTELTGVVLPESPQHKSQSEHNNMTYLEGLKQALFGELNAVKKYRETMAYMPNSQLYNMFMFVLTDEITHANKYNYLINMNK